MPTRSAGQNPIAPYSEPERFIHQTLRKKKKRNQFIPIEDRVPKTKYPPFENLFEAKVAYNPFLDLPFPMADDQPMWGNNRADLLCSFHGHGLGRGTIIQIFYHGLNEPTQAILDAGGIFLYKTPNEAHQFLEDQVLLKLDWSKENKTKPLRKTVSFAESEENSPLLEKMEALTKRIDSQFKEIRGYMNEIDATNFGRIYDHQSSRPPGTLPSNTQTNPKPSTSNKNPYRPPPAQNEHVNAVFTRSGKTYNPPANPNTKTAVYLDDSEDEAEEECSAILRNKIPPKLGDPGSFLIPFKLANSVEYLSLADLGASINLISYSLYAALFGTTLKPTRMNFVILQIEEDDRVPLILRRPFLLTADVIIRVKNKELNLGIGEDRATFHIDKAMQHSHVNDDTCFCMDISETQLDKEFDKFMLGNVQEDEVKDDFEELPLKDELRIRTSIQDPPTDLELKPLPKYAFPKENSLLPVVMSALLEQNEKERLVSILKNHKEAFA
ncbi:hypothetical protein Tco_0321975 [Tanacetum coccineum]